MNILTRSILALSLIAAPALSFAQAAQDPITRAEVRADLIRLEQAGYVPSRINDTRYPEDLQAAVARVQSANGVAAPQAHPPKQATATMAMGMPRVDEPRDPFYFGA